MSRKLPKAKTRDIVIQYVDEEVLIYDLITHKAHNLNKTASIVYNSCDGSTSIEDLKSRFKIPDEVVFFAIDELSRNGLIDEQTNYVSPFLGMNRRQIIRKVGQVSVVAIPLISSLVAPNAISAGSCVNTGGLPPGADVGGGVCGRPDTSLCQTLCNLAFYRDSCCSGTTALSGSPCPDCTCVCA